ncbi:HIT family protein [Flavobacterium artemisiae]|uniref:HIT family protein n=1 Tax=Flavobacterium artemisiae TaxID=2126556 RepID=A0ABW4HJS9_9FLAO
MEECRFCKIIEGDRENEEIIFEDDLFIIVADKYRQTSIGSICLLIPKKHYKNILELSDDHSKRLIPILKNINYAMQKAYNCKAIRIWTAVNKEAGQSIFHCHIHVVPCNSLKDRIIASFPGIYDLKRRILRFGNNQINSKKNFELADKLRLEMIKQHHNAY